MHEDTNVVIKSKNRQRQNRKEKKGHTIKCETIHVKRKPPVQLHTLGHDDATPTSRITATIAVIRNCILCRQSTNIKYICLIVIVQCRLTSYVCKAMKRMINAHLVWFLEFNGLLSNIQYGLRQGRNTLDHLVRFETFISGTVNINYI
jgi:hypothetical protein